MIVVYGTIGAGPFGECGRSLPVLARILPRSSSPAA